jgi:type IV secretory pathway VirJ component
MKKHLVLLLLILTAQLWQTSNAATERAASSIRDLPLSEVAAATHGDTLALLITGDGGWAELDQQVSAELARSGIPVVALSSLKYFWQSRTPELVTHDVAAVLRHYLTTWHRNRIVLIGYSFGADVMPFIVNRLPQDLRARVISVNLLGLSANATFEVSAAVLLHGSPEPLMPTGPEISRMRNVPVLCVYGEGEKESLCPSLAAHSVKRVRIGNGHHFSGEYRALADAIVGLAAQERSRGS